MRSDQQIRVAGMVGTLLAYVVHVVLNGSGPLVVGAYQVSTFVVVAATVLTLALPETLDRFPFGPTRDGG